MLHLPKAGIILDACAAPGGKTLVLAGRSGPQVRIEANELSSERRRRLRDVLDGQLPHVTRARVSVTGYDAARLCRTTKNRYDAILLDAPCSSERHVLNSQRALSVWTPARTRQLALRQWSLLSSCFLMLKPGGCLVYSTCSISPMENDGVLRRLVEKYGDHCDIFDVEWGEKRRSALLFSPMPRTAPVRSLWRISTKTLGADKHRRIDRRPCSSAAKEFFLFPSIDVRPGRQKHISTFFRRGLCSFPPFFYRAPLFRR